MSNKLADYLARRDILEIEEVLLARAMLICSIAKHFPDPRQAVIRLLGELDQETLVSCTRVKEPWQGEALWEIAHSFDQPLAALEFLLKEKVKDDLFMHKLQPIASTEKYAAKLRRAHGIASNVDLLKFRLQNDSFVPVYQCAIKYDWAAIADAQYEGRWPD